MRSGDAAKDAETPRRGDAGSRVSASPRPAVSASRSSSIPEVQLFTDGACSGNPGPGGWAFILRHPASGKQIERSGGEAETTNNRMELTSVVRGLESLKRATHVEILTDSEYVRKGLSEWMPKWKTNGWRRREGKQLKEVKNVDLWRRLDELVAKHQVTYTRVAGHSGHPENDRCDELAVAAYQKYR
jgi:ribonuclease HI